MGIQVSDITFRYRMGKTIFDVTIFYFHILDSHELAGIFFKYDMSPLKIIIREEEYTILQFILRIISCAAGLYIVAGEMISEIFT